MKKNPVQLEDCTERPRRSHEALATCQGLKEGIGIPIKTDPMKTMKKRPSVPMDCYNVPMDCYNEHEVP